MSGVAAPSAAAPGPPGEGGDAPARPTRIADLAALAACAGLASLYLTRQFVDGDEAVFAAIAMRIREFGLPAYEAGWDHKPPALVHLYALLLAPWDGLSMLPLRVASAGCWLGTAWICGAAARRVAGPLAFAPAVLAYGLLRSFGETKAGAANAEAFLSPLVAGAVFLVVLARSRRGAACVAAGALLALAALLKPNAAIFGPAAVAAAALVRGGREGLRAALAGTAGALVVLVPTVATLVANGTWPDAVWLVVDANRIYMESAPALGIAGHLGVFAREVRLTPAPWLLSAFAAAAVLVRPADWGEPRLARRAVAGASVLFAAGSVAVAAGGNYFRHYWWMLAPILAFSCACGVAAVRRVVRRPLVACALVAAAVALLWMPSQYVDKRRVLRSFLFDAAAPSPYAGPAPVALAAAVARHTRPGDAIWIWGSHPEVYVMAGRPSASRQVTAHLLTGALRMDVRSGAAPPQPDLCPRAWETLEADLAARPPALIVDTSGSGYRQWNLFPPERFPRLVRLLEASYERGETVAGSTLWLRRAR